MGKPGVMFYFEVRPCLRRLTAEEKGVLFDAILDYGEFGAEPELEGMVGVAWDFLRPRLDRDNDRYERQIDQKQYALYVREAKKQNIQPLSMSDWKLRQKEGADREASAAISRYQPMLFDNQTTNINQQTSDSIPQISNSIPQISNSIPQTTNLIPQREPDGTSGGDLCFPPSEEAVSRYCREAGLKLDVKQFVDYYSGNGWMVGQNKMKDWRAVARNWSRKENGKHGKTGSERLCSAIGTSL